MSAQTDRRGFFGGEAEAGAKKRGAPKTGEGEDRSHESALCEEDEPRVAVGEDTAESAGEGADGAILRAQRGGRETLLADLGRVVAHRRPDRGANAKQNHG